MKVLIINKYLYRKGGTETYIAEVGRALEAAGHTVQYFGMDDPRREFCNGLDSYAPPMDFQSVGFLAQGAYLFRVLYSREARRKLRPLLHAFQPDIIHLNLFNFQLTPAILLEAARYRKQVKPSARIVYTAHDYQLVCPNHLMSPSATHIPCSQCLDGNYWHCVRQRCIHGSYARSLMGAIEARLWHTARVYRQIDTIVCPSRFIAEKLSQNAMLRGKLVVLRNFIGQQAPAAQPAAGAPYVLYFGRLSEEKGIQSLLAACRLCPEIRFVFAGSGPMEHAISGPNITKAGFLQGAALTDAIRNARLTVCPSVCYENCPFSVIESMACETPVLGANIGGIPELIADGKTGELFESGNAQSLALHLRGMWQRPALLAAYRANCAGRSFDSASDYVKKLLAQVYAPGQAVEIPAQ